MEERRGGGDDDDGMTGSMEWHDGRETGHFFGSWCSSLASDDIDAEHFFCCLSCRCAVGE